MNRNRINFVKQVFILCLLSVIAFNANALDEGWVKKPNVAQYGGADWKNEVKRASGLSVEDAKRIAEKDPRITFFFYMKQGMSLSGKGYFRPGDAVFFSGKPWYGSAPQADAYEKKGWVKKPNVAQYGGAENKFCWKDSYGRGIGTVPGACAAGRDRIGQLCYTKCPAHTARFGFDCHSVCPPGMRNDGLFCRAAEYGRGAGYPWKFGDALNDNGMRSRCEADHGRGNCEKNGLIYYPKCKQGYHNFGCCICRPKVPNCKALGLNSGIDLSCAKKIIIGDPVTGVCLSGEEKDAGLCYKACKPGYNGVGPVCWGQPPKGWVQCGMGAAKDSKTCASIIFGQVASVGQMALTIASLGSSTALTAGMSAPKKASRLTKLKQELSRLKVAFDNLKKTNQKVKKALEAFDAANKGRQGYVAMDTASNAVTEEDIARVAAQIAAIVDSSGVSSTVAAYTYPKCSKYFKGGLVAPPSAPTSASGTAQVQVKGPTVKKVTFSGGAAFVNVSQGVWNELRADGSKAFVFKEVTRDEWSVYLVDNSRGVKIQLDLWKKDIIYSDSTGKRFVLAKVDSASVTQ